MITVWDKFFILCFEFFLDEGTTGVAVLGRGSNDDGSTFGPKKLTTETDLWFSPMVWCRVPKNLLMMIRILVGEEMFFFWFFPIFVSNHDITFVHLSISKRQPSSRFCEDFLFFIPAASGLMALSKIWEIQIGSQCSSEIMQDGDFLRFFFKLSSQAIFFGRVTCLHQNVCT